jgi:uncharacterized protein YciI
MKTAMKAVVFYAAQPVSMDQVMAVFPRHKVCVNAFVERGECLAIGPFGDPIKEGSMAVFRDRASAEAFVAQDPFVLEGIVTPTIRDWKEDVLK